MAECVEMRETHFIIDLIHKCIEIRDTILKLMEMHFWTSNDNILDLNSQDPNIYNTIENKDLFDAYLEMITVIFSIEEIREKTHASYSETDNVISPIKEAVNRFRTYRFLYDPMLLNYINNHTHQLSKEFHRFFMQPKGWNSNYIKFI